MNPSEEIIKTALLGTQKYIPQIGGDIQEIIGKIEANSTDKEDKFLKMAATVLLYEEAGANPMEFKEKINPCPSEKRKLISPFIRDLIWTSINSKEHYVFKYLMNKCFQHQLVLSPDLIPTILNKVQDNKKQGAILLELCGETGKWLCTLNENWKNFVQASSEESIWETGNLEQRKNFLSNLRINNPKKAIELLTRDLEKENANNRAEFMAILETNLSIEDEVFLKSLSKDKSQKVKQIALDLLKKMNGSTVNNEFVNFLLQNISLGSKKILKISDNIPEPEHLFKLGMNKVSSQKGIDDALFWIAYCIELSHPEKITKSLNISESEWLKACLEHKNADYLFISLVQSAIHFKHQNWARKLLATQNVLAIDLFSLLPTTEFIELIEPYIQSDFQVVINYLDDENYTIFPLEIAQKIIQHLEKNPYSINRPDYQRLALQLPTSILSSLSDYQKGVNQEYSFRYFKEQVAEMIRIIEWRENCQF